MNKVKTINPLNVCEECAINPQTVIIFDRRWAPGRGEEVGVKLVCRECADKIMDEIYPEYEEICPNCGCEIPVN